MKKLLFLIPIAILITGTACNEDNSKKNNNEPIVTEKVIDKKELITEQEIIEDVITLKFTASYTKKKIYIVTDGKKVLAIHTIHDHAQEYRQKLINDGKNAIIYVSESEIADVK